MSEIRYGKPSMTNLPYELGKSIFDEIMNKRDEYYILADFDAYVKAQEKVAELYQDRKLWNKMCLVNIANSSFFTSDRTIKSYAEEIWKLEEVK